MVGPVSHDQNFKNLIFDYPQQALEFFAVAQYQADAGVLQPVAQTVASLEVPQPVALFPAELLCALPWGHHAELMAKVKDLPCGQFILLLHFVCLKHLLLAR